MKCFFNKFAFPLAFRKRIKRHVSSSFNLFRVFSPQTVISRYTRFGSFKLNGFLFSSYSKYLRFVPTLSTLFSRATFFKTLTIKVKEIEESTVQPVRFYHVPLNVWKECAWCGISDLLSGSWKINKILAIRKLLLINVCFAKCYHTYSRQSFYINLYVFCTPCKISRRKKKQTNKKLMVALL